MAPRRGSPKIPGKHKPLAGQVMFLDLPRGFRGVGTFESDVVSLGGRVVPCLDSGVSCVITNRNDKSLPKGSLSGKAFWAPQPRRRARVRTMEKQQRSSRQHNSRVDVLATASSWGIPIKHVKVVLKWIENFKKRQSSWRKQTTSSKSSVTSRSAPLTRKQHIRNSRVENTSCKTKCVCLRRDFTEKVGICPFDNALGPRSIQTRATTHQLQSSSGPFRTSFNRQRTTGFCELCNISFDKLVSVQTILHATFADYWRNYDKLVHDSVAGPDINALLRNLRNQNRKSTSSLSTIKKTKVRVAKRGYSHTQESRTSRNHDSSNLKTPNSSASPIEWCPSPTPTKQRRAEKNELRKRLNQVQRKLSFSGFGDDPIKSKILTASRRRSVSTPQLTTPKKRKLESSGSYSEILPSSQRRPDRDRSTLTKRAGSQVEPRRKSASHALDVRKQGQRSEFLKSKKARNQSTIERSPSPTLSKRRQAEKNELRRRLHQVQRRLSFSGYDHDPVDSKILTGTRKRIASSQPRPANSSYVPQKKNNRESNLYGSYSKKPPSDRRLVGPGRTSASAQKPPNKSVRRKSAVIEDLMTRLDDAKSNRLENGQHVSEPVPSKDKRTKKRPRPRRTCGDYRRKSGSGTGEPTVQQVARELKRELAACTPVICTMSLRNGKMKFSES